MSALYRFMMVILVILLVGCSSRSVLMQRTEAECVRTCKDNYYHCNQVCHNNCKECNQASVRRSVCNYQQYLHEQSIQGAIVTRQLNSYRDPLQCRKITCDCPNDFNVCVQSCKGIIHKRLQLVHDCC